MKWVQAIKEIRWKAPATGSPVATVKQTPNTAITLTLTAPKPAAAAPAASDVQIINLIGLHNEWNLKEVTVKAGAKVRFVIKNGDDEKHNIVGIGEGLNLLSPDIPAGKTAEYEWTAPSTPITFNTLCSYHPTMILKIIVQ